MVDFRKYIVRNYIVRNYIARLHPSPVLKHAATGEMLYTRN
jgi:hypothetical protein